MTDKQTEVSDLLKPRYKVIALWPFELESSIGSIYNEPPLPKEGQFEQAWQWWDEMGKHPHLFKRLEWWEERDWSILEEVKYVKTHAGNSVRTVKEFQTRLEKIVLDGGKVRPIKHWIPATKEEYESFINQNKQS